MAGLNNKNVTSLKENNYRDDRKENSAGLLSVEAPYVFYQNGLYYF